MYLSLWHFGHFSILHATILFLYHAAKFVGFAPFGLINNYLGIQPEREPRMTHSLKTLLVVLSRVPCCGRKRPFLILSQQKINAYELFLHYGLLASLSTSNICAQKHMVGVILVWKYKLNCKLKGALSVCPVKEIFHPGNGFQTLTLFSFLGCRKW